MRQRGWAQVLRMCLNRILLAAVTNNRRRAGVRGMAPPGLVTNGGKWKSENQMFCRNTITIYSSALSRSSYSWSASSCPSWSAWRSGRPGVWAASWAAGGGSSPWCWWWPGRAGAAPRTPARGTAARSCPGQRSSVWEGRYKVLFK